MKRNRQQQRFALAALLITLLSSSAVAQQKKKASLRRRPVLAFVTNNPSDYWSFARLGMEKAQRELPQFNMVFRIPAGGAVPEQKMILGDLVAQGAKGIAISPIDPANQTADLNALAEKTMLITQDADAPRSNRLAFVGPDNHAAGELAGRLMLQAIPRGGDIALFVGIRTSDNARQREQGIRDALRGSNIHVVEVFEDTADRQTAKRNVTNALKKYPHIAGMIGLWSYNGPAIVDSLSDANETGKVRTVCFDEEKETLKAVRKGSIYATVVSQPFELGYQSMKLLARLSNNPTLLPPDRHLFIPMKVIKRDSVDAFERRLKQREKILEQAARDSAG